MKGRNVTRGFLPACIDLIISVQEISLPGNNLSVGETLQKSLHHKTPTEK